MRNTNEPGTCPNCHTAIPEEAPGGLCPKCALEAAATVASTTAGGRHTPPPAVADIAPHFPDLEILELLGAGGMGAVYKARQPQLDRFVALKILSHDLAGDPAFVERFNREARVLARLSHPNIVGVHNFGTTGPYCYLTMEFVDGVNLRQAMRAGRFTPTESLAMVEHLCAALKFAHEEGILHRDIKPENVLIDSKGRVKIADFGIAKLVGEPRQGDFTLTLQGAVLGSPHYMAPEQIETPGDVDQRADIYSLGVVLYELLTGELPIGRFALPSEKAAVDARIDAIVLRTLEKERQARFQTAEEVRTEVEAVAKNPAAAPGTGFSGEAAVARFSLTAAILTALSLVLVALLALINVSANASSLSGKFFIVTGTALFLLGLPAAIAAVTSFFLGIRALGEIRASAGSRGGLGNAIFAVVAWPILVMFLLALGVMPLGGSVGWLLLMPIAVLPVLVATRMLVRALSRWARGVERENGTRYHPGLGRPLGRVLLVGLVAPIVLKLGVGFAGSRLQGTEGLDPEIARAEAQALGVAVKTLVDSDSLTDGIDWRLREPEVKLAVILKPGLKADFEVVKHEADGTKVVVDLGETHVDPEGGSGQDIFLIKIGTVLKPHDTQGSIQSMVVVRGGPHGKTSHTGEDLRGWSFNAEQPGMLTLDCPGHHDINLAAQRVVGEDGVPSLGSLSLKVVVTSMDD
jgi:tRNA A-37 threonylcarbamoyl transferase component Bud32